VAHWQIEAALIHSGWPIDSEVVPYHKYQGNRTFLSNLQKAHDLAFASMAEVPPTLRSINEGSDEQEFFIGTLEESIRNFAKEHNLTFPEAAPLSNESV
jgi:hypothetical protein